MTLYIYVDETTCWIGGKEYWGAGALVTEVPIAQGLITQAISNLGSDPDIHKPLCAKQDARTLQRRYFHACDDSANAKSHLCREIKANITATLDLSYQLKPAPGTQLATAQEENTHRLNSMLASLAGLNTTQPVEMHFETRSTFSKAAAEELIEDLYRQLDAGVYTHPFLPNYYPPVVVNIGTKADPGLQVADYALWAVNNHLDENKKAHWACRANIDRFSVNQLQDPTGNILLGGEYRINGGILPAASPPFSYPQSLFPLDDRLYSQSALAGLYVMAENVLHQVSRNGLPPHASHLNVGLQKLCRRLRSVDPIRCADVQEVARVFIRLFDTLPLYGGLDPVRDLQKFQHMVYARYYLSLTLNRNLANGTRTCDFFADVRNAHQAAKPGDLWK